MSSHIKTEDYEVLVDGNVVTIQGVLRLPTPVSYGELFDPIKSILESGDEGPIVDIRQVTFLNSSGITALARLIVLARTVNKAILFKGTDDVPWQRKSLTSLQRLWDKVELKLN